jgi:hypothetical protein
VKHNVSWTFSACNRRSRFNFSSIHTRPLRDMRNSHSEHFGEVSIVGRRTAI